MDEEATLTPSRVTLCGTFGMGHARDVVLPRVVRDIAQSIGIDLSADLITGRDHPPEPSVIGLGPQDLERRKSLKGQPALVCGHGVIEPLASCAFLRCRKVLKKTHTTLSSLFAASLEPGTYPPLTKWMLRSALRNMQGLYLADEFSAERIRPMVGNRPVEVIGELALSLRAGNTLPDAVAGVNRYITVCLSPVWANEGGWRGWITRRLVELADVLNAAIVFVPISTKREDDRLEARKTAGKMKQLSRGEQIILIDEVLPPRQMAALFKQSLLTVSMRLHGCVLSYAQHTPFVGLLNHPKIYGFAKTIGKPEWVVPQVPVSADESHAYGFHFSQLPMEQASFIQTALQAVEHASFEKLPYFINRQREVLAELLGQQT